jgi:hypothetical protein
MSHIRLRRSAKIFSLYCTWILLRVGGLLNVVDHVEVDESFQSHTRQDSLHLSNNFDIFNHLLYYFSAEEMSQIASNML